MQLLLNHQNYLNQFSTLLNKLPSKWTVRCIQLLFLLFNLCIQETFGSFFIEQTSRTQILIYWALFFSLKGLNISAHFQTFKILKVFVTWHIKPSFLLQTFVGYVLIFVSKISVVYFTSPAVFVSFMNELGCLTSSWEKRFAIKQITNQTNSVILILWLEYYIRTRLVKQILQLKGLWNLFINTLGIIFNDYNHYYSYITQFQEPIYSMFNQHNQKNNISVTLSRLSCEYQIVYDACVFYSKISTKSPSWFKIVDNSQNSLTQCQRKLNFQIKFRKQSVKVGQFKNSLPQSSLTASNLKIVTDANHEKSYQRSHQSSKGKINLSIQSLQNTKNSNQGKSISICQKKKNSNKQTVCENENLKVSDQLQKNNIANVIPFQESHRNKNRKVKNHQSLVQLQNKANDLTLNKSINQSMNMNSTLQTNKIKIDKNYNLEALLKYKCSTKVKYELKSLYNNILTLEVTLLSSRPITIFGYYKSMVKTLKVSKKFRIMQNSIEQSYQIKQKVRKSSNNGSISSCEQDFFQIRENQQIIFRRQSRGQKVVMTFVFQIDSQNKNNVETAE